MYFKGCVQGHNKVTIPIKNQCRYAKIKIFTASKVANHSFNVMTPPSLQPTAPFWLVVPTYNPGQAVWSEWIRALQMQTVQPQRVVVVDSGSTDGTQQLSQQAGFLGLSVAAQHFNHGGTRQWALDQALTAHTQTPPTQSPPTWVVYLTQDAILANPQSLQNLLQAFQDERVAGVYGRQLPHPHASWMETHARHFNYPATSKTVTVQDKESMGLKVCFFSDAFSAYRLSALQQQVVFHDMCLWEKTPSWPPNFCWQATVCDTKRRLTFIIHTITTGFRIFSACLTPAFFTHSTLGLEKHLAQLKAKVGAMPKTKWPF